jgi:hypothetical protein
MTKFKIIDNKLVPIIEDNFEIKNAKLINLLLDDTLIAYGDNSIITFDSESLLGVSYRPTYKHESFVLRDEQQFVYIKNFTREILQEFLKESMAAVRYNQYFLVESETVIELLTFVWYSPQHCNKPDLFKVNSFDKKSNLWENSKFKIEKFTNYFGCEVAVSMNLLFPDTYDYLLYGNLTESSNCKGMWIEAMKALSKSFNYSLRCKVELMNTTGEPDVVVRNNMLRDAIKHFKNPGGVKFDTHFQVTSLVTMKPYHLEGVFFAVPPGEEYNGYEKLILPFDYYTWLAIFFTFFATFATIFFVILCMPSIRKVLFGENVRSPSLNVAAHFFGLGQNVLPKKSFARFILMAFIIFSLIIRNAWQGKMFEYLSKNITKPQLQSIDEIVDKNYTLFPSSASDSVLTLVDKG